MKTKKKPSKKPFPFAGTNGRCMVMAAHRYCLPRHSYIVGTCIDWLTEWWSEFDFDVQMHVVRDTLEALQDFKATESGMVGFSCDRIAWKNFAEWAWGTLNEAQKKYCKDAIVHRNKPWPLTSKEIDAGKPKGKKSGK